MKSRLPCWSFGVVIKPSPENMLDVLGVTSDGIKPLFVSQERKSKGACLVRGSPTNFSQVSRDPVVDSPPVHEQRRKATHHRPHLWAGQLPSQEIEPEDICRRCSHNKEYDRRSFHVGSIVSEWSRLLCLHRTMKIEMGWHMDTGLCIYIRIFWEKFRSSSWDFLPQMVAVWLTRMCWSLHTKTMPNQVHTLINGLGVKYVLSSINWNVSCPWSKKLKIILRLWPIPLHSIS